MLKAYVLAGLAAVLPGCATPTIASWKGKVEWPDDYSGKNIVPSMEAGAALAAAGAIREMVRQTLATDPGLFWGCSSPEQGLDVAVYRGPTPGLYYVMLEEHFDSVQWSALPCARLVARVRSHPSRQGGG